jgi:hypothetical protein
MKFRDLIARTDSEPACQSSELAELFNLYELSVDMVPHMALHTAGGHARMTWQRGDRPLELRRRPVLTVGQERVLRADQLLDPLCLWRSCLGTIEIVRDRISGLVVPWRIVWIEFRRTPAICVPPCNQKGSHDWVVHRNVSPTFGIVLLILPIVKSVFPCFFETD